MLCVRLLPGARGVSLRRPAGAGLDVGHRAAAVALRPRFVHVSAPACSIPGASSGQQSQQQPPSIAPPLAGLRVVDLTRVLAGPYCTMLLADLGADVIKIEHPRGGDDTRSWAPPSAPHLPTSALPKDVLAQLSARKRQYWDNLPPESAYFLSVNRNKRSMTVDLKSEEGRAIVHELIRNADVLVENYLPGKLAEMQLGYEDAKRLNPVRASVVMAWILMETWPQQADQ